MRPFLLFPLAALVIAAAPRAALATEGGGQAKRSASIPSWPA